MIRNQLTLTFILFVFAVSTSVKFMAAHDGPEPELTAEFVQTQVTERKVAVEKMIKALEDPRFWATNEDLAVATAKALGELRAPEAVPVLVAHMTEQWPKLPPTRPRIIDDYPVAKALIMIGLPAVRPIMAASAKDANLKWLADQALNAILPNWALCFKAEPEDKPNK